MQEFWFCARCSSMNRGDTAPSDRDTEPAVPDEAPPSDLDVGGGI
jgi:hypothetical protein